MATINAKSTTANTAEKTTTDAVKSTVEKAGASVKAATDKVVAAVKPVEEKATETVKKVADTVKPVAEKAADTVKTTAKKTASKAKSAVKKTAAKAKVKAASGKDDVTTKVYVQYAGNEVLENDVLERVKEAYVALKELVPQMDYDGVEMVLNQLEEYKLKEEDEKKVAQLKKNLKLFDWDKMEELL